MANGAVTLTSPAEGGCLCGAVRFRIEGKIEEAAYCHCRSCQRQSASPAVPWFSIAPSQFRFLKGKPKGYRASDHATREFCGDCGTYLLFREDDATMTLGVNTIALDDPALVPPAFHIWTDRRVKWFETKDDFPRYPRGKS